MRAFLLVGVVCLAATLAVTAASSPVLEARRSQAAEQPTGIVEALQRIGERVQAYYDRFRSIICSETVVQQHLTRDLIPDGRARVFLYELRIESLPATEGRGVEFTAMRTLRQIDGRTPRASYEPECMDPHQAYSEPLMFLLPQNQGDYRFTLAGTARVQDKDALTIAYAAVRSERPRVTWKENCFTVAASGHNRGRLWVDATTFDVLQVESRLIKPMVFPIPPAMWRNVATRRLTLERADTSVRYRPVTFQEPEETVNLPASVETVTVIDGSAAPRVRIRQSFREYRRFLTESRVRP